MGEKLERGREKKGVREEGKEKERRGKRLEINLQGGARDRLFPIFLNPRVLMFPPCSDRMILPSEFFSTLLINPEKLFLMKKFYLEL